MAVTKLKHHDKCEVQIVTGYSWNHLAHLECCDANCKHKTRWIQWINGKYMNSLIALGVPVKESLVVNIKGKLFNRKDLGI